MSMKIVFIASSIQDPHAIKRIEEFVAQGYEVVVYGFSRKRTIPMQKHNFSIQCIGEYSNEKPYWNRIHLILKALRNVKKRHATEQVLWYYFGLDIALCAMIIGHMKPYIYEECDLVHTYIGNHFVRSVLEMIDKWLIRKALISIFTSEGFLIYHFGNKKPKNSYVLANKLNTDILTVPKVEKKSIDLNHLSFAFVGGARFDSLVSFSEIISKNFPSYSFHFFGEPVAQYRERFNELRSLYQNVFFHGAFKNPDDLPTIYSQIDIVVSTYDAKYENVKYAEPNKIYEAIYFETPIVVTEGTFLAEKVSRLKIGYVVNPFDEKSVCKWVKKLSKESIEEKKKSCSLINKRDCLNINDSFFSDFKSKVFDRR